MSIFGDLFGSSGGAQTAQQSRNPWGPAIPFLQQIMSGAQNAYNTGAGTQSWSGPLLAGQSGDTTRAMDLTRSIAGTGGAVPYLGGAMGALSGIAGGNQSHRQNQGEANLANLAWRPGINTADDFSRAASQARGLTSGAQSMAGGVANQYGNVFQDAGGATASDTYLKDMASGQDAGKNPYLMQLLDANAARTANRVNSIASSQGRYGSGGHTDLMARSIAEANLPALMRAYEFDKGNQLAATGQIDQSRLGARGQQLASLGGQGQMAGLLGNLKQGDMGLRLNALQGQTGAEGQNAAMRFNAANALASGERADTANRMGAAGGLLGGAAQYNQALYDPAQRLGAVGQMQDTRSQAEQDFQRQQFEMQQQMPWMQLRNYMGLLGPIAGLGGTSTGSSQQQAPWFGQQGLSNLAPIISAGLGLFSDKNAKTDIEKIGTSERTGLPIYSYRYKGDPKSYPKVVGPMAQDIEKKFPGSTGVLDGKMYVKPHAVGLLGAM